MSEHYGEPLENFNFHLPGGIDYSDDELVNEEIREAHVEVVQRSNYDIPPVNDHEAAQSAQEADFAFWERESYEFQSEENLERIPIGWQESTNWAFLLTLFHHMLYILQISVADIHLPRSPALAIKYTSYIMRGRSPQSRIKLFIRYSVRYFLQRRISLMKRLGLILYFLQQLSSFRGVQSAEPRNWRTDVRKIDLVNLVENNQLDWIFPRVTNCSLICPLQVKWRDCSPGQDDDFLFRTDKGMLLRDTIPSNCTLDNPQEPPSNFSSRFHLIDRRDQSEQEPDSDDTEYESSGYTEDEDEVIYPLRHIQHMESKCVKIDPFCNNWHKTAHVFKPKKLSFWVKEIFVPMLKSIGSKLKVDTPVNAETPLFDRHQAIWRDLASAELKSDLSTSDLIEQTAKLQSVHIQYTVKVLVELRDAINEYNRVILIALTMFGFNLLVNLGRMLYFVLDRYCSKDVRHMKQLKEAQQQLDLYSELLPTERVGLRRLQQDRQTDRQRPIAIE